MKKECCKYKICESCIQRLKDAFEFKSSVEYANSVLNQLGLYLMIYGIFLFL